MSNQSIYDAFERMWQHTVALVESSSSMVGDSVLSFSEDGGLYCANWSTGNVGLKGVSFNNKTTGQEAFSINTSSASGEDAFAAGVNSLASGYYSAVFGRDNTASGAGAFVAGSGNTGRNLQTVFGHFAQVYSTDLVNYHPANAVTNGINHTLFKVGNGTSASALSNAFIVRANGEATAQTSITSDEGADFAEMFEWSDGNIENDDRRGFFVTITEEGKIRIANADDYVDGVVSAKPTVIGDSADMTWRGKYVTDVFGTRLTEEVEIKAEEKLDDGTVIPAEYETRFIINPDYNEELDYVPRRDRPEWAAIGLLGKVIVIDDGTCQPGGFCTNADGGIATKSDTRTAWRVLERLDANHIKILYR